MKVKILRAIDDYEIAIRYTDEIAEHENLTDEEAYKMEMELKRCGRYWLDADRICFPCA